MHINLNKVSGCLGSISLPHVTPCILTRSPAGGMVQQFSDIRNLTFSVQKKPYNALEKKRFVALKATFGTPLVFVEGYTEVEEIQGMRLNLDGQSPKVEYLVKWKDGSDTTWEQAINLSEDLIRQYEDSWWQAARKADLQVIAKMLGGGREALAQVVDENSRSALHFAAALGNVDCVKILVEAGANVNLQDKEGYTPLHMAGGYMHTSTMTALLEAGSDPEVKDNSGKDVVQLVDNLRRTLPLSAASITRRIALEQVSGVLTDKVYEEVLPAQVLNSRKRVADGGTEYLVKYPDGRDDEWIDEGSLSPDVIEDYQAGLEYAAAVNIVDVVQVGTARRFKVEWSDGYPVSWEPEEHLPEELIALFQQQNPQLFEQRTSGASTNSEEDVLQAWPLNAELEWGPSAKERDSSEYPTQYAPLQIRVQTPITATSKTPVNEIEANNARQTVGSIS
ncbi:hypothetical protein CEUSTIGMA_g5158.t1 [Chlamydomonas eustigma]|uniref:Chromo domain-containing protein n=1 Tax=Chlamydomonas eustigma TaxID=1157962 RepID=A0A250X3R6_9CHLO|nr:hypothetical protein CEUSTIGMA_g5158.t1 [Chlamydomonas eustigma]|eukprot:GAX77715.1 hypothetical protein CEUSTIGMA_g5158.t1 [Chlamydomonas eustigma]